MDLSKIFLKDACPTSIGGQAVMGGVMMRGTDRMAIAMRVPDGRIHIKTQPIKPIGRLGQDSYCPRSGFVFLAPWS